jgi:hypothetical protein
MNIQPSGYLVARWNSIRCTANDLFQTLLLAVPDTRLRECTLPGSGHLSPAWLWFSGSFLIVLAWTVVIQFFGSFNMKWIDYGQFMILYFSGNLQG